MTWLKWARVMSDLAWEIHCRLKNINEKVTCICVGAINSIFFERTRVLTTSGWRFPVSDDQIVDSKTRPQNVIISFTFLIVLFLQAQIIVHRYYSFIQAISIAPLQVHYHSEALPTQHGHCVGVSRRSATGNCKWRTCQRFLRGG